MACFKKEVKFQRIPYRSLKITNFWDGKGLFGVFFVFFLNLFSLLPLRKLQNIGIEGQVASGKEGIGTKTGNKKKVQEFWTDRRPGKRRGPRSFLFRVGYTAAFQKDLSLK